MKDPKSKIGERLKELRLKFNYTQEYIGEVLEKADYTAYQRIEHGRSELKYADAYKLARLYKIPMEQILNSDPRVQDDTKINVKQSEILNSPFRNVVQLTVSLDGSDNMLHDQIEFLIGVNKLLKGGKY